MSTKSDKHLRLNWFALAIIVSMAFSSGCYQRTVAPELSFDESKMEVLESEIKKLEW
jgi:hypothetical protein